MKKGISLLIAIILILTSAGAFSALAGTSPYEERGQWQFSSSYEDNQESYAKIEDTNVYEGEKSLYITNADANGSVTVTSPEITGLVSGEEYKISFYEKGTFSANKLEYGFTGGTVKKTSGASTYTKRQGSVTYEGDGTGTICFNLVGRYKVGTTDKGPSEVHIDAVEISDSSENVIWKAGFEEPVIIGGAPEDFPVDVLMDNSTIANTLVLAWFNPNRDDIRRITVRDYDTNEIVADSNNGDISLKNRDKIVLKIKDFDKAEPRKFKILCYYDDLTTEYICSSNFSSYVQTVGNSMVNGMNMAKAIKADTQFMFADGHPKIVDGDYAYEVIAVKDNGEEANHYMALECMTKEGFAVGKRYHFKVVYKSTNTSGVAWQTDSWKWVNNDYVENAVINDAGNSWKAYEWDYAPKGASTAPGPQIFFNSFVESFLVRSVEIYEMKYDEEDLEDGVPKDGAVMKQTGENLSKVGNVGDSIMFTQAEKVKGLTAEKGSREATLSWTMPAQAKGVNIYQVVNGKKILKARLDKDCESINFKNLVNYHEYEFVVCTINQSGIDSEGVTVKVTPEEDPLDVTDVILKRDGVEAANIASAGEYTATITVANNTLEPRNVEFFALYTVDGMIKLADFASETLLIGGEKTLTCTINIAEPVEKDLLKVFLWDSIEGMTSLMPAVSYK